MVKRVRHYGMGQLLMVMFDALEPCAQETLYSSTTLATEVVSHQRLAQTGTLRRFARRRG